VAGIEVAVDIQSTDPVTTDADGSYTVEDVTPGERRLYARGDGWIPHSRRPQYEDVTDFLPDFHRMAAEAGRDLASVPVTVWGIPEDLDRIRRHQDQGVARGVVQLAAANADTIMPILDRWAGLIRQLGG
jgi:hypothetical protein